MLFNEMQFNANRWFHADIYILKSYISVSSKPSKTQ